MAQVINHKKALIKLIREASRRHSPYDVFRDFCEMGAICISNSVDHYQAEKREAQYMQLIGKYEPAAQQLFPHMLAELTECLEDGPDDVLGRVYMEMEFGNKGNGQFFTPMEVAEMMAMVTLGDPAVLLQELVHIVRDMLKDCEDHSSRLTAIKRTLYSKI